MKNTKTTKALKIYETLSHEAFMLKEEASRLHWEEKKYNESRAKHKEAQTKRIAALYAADNLALAMYEEYAQPIIEVFNKYVNKPYGEKTKEKIREEIKAAYNCSIWFERWQTLNSTLHISLLDKNGYCRSNSAAQIEVELNTQHTDNNNKIQKVEAVKLTGKYYHAKKTNPEKAAATYLKEVQKLEEELKKINKKIDQFNDNVKACAMEYLSRAKDYGINNY